jgi:hypothetical protein
MMVAGLLTSMTGALFVTAAGFGTTAVMLKTAWLRDWLYHGQHLLYGIQNLSAELRTLPAIAYGHQLTGAADAGVFFAICIAFPVLTLMLTGLIAVLRVVDAAPAPGDPRRGGGDPPGPDPAPAPSGGGRSAGTGEDSGLAAGLPGLPAVSGLPGLPGLPGPGPDIEQDRLAGALADAAVQPAGTR